MTQDTGMHARRLPRRNVLADDVYELVKAMVMDHVIRPGARVSIDGLARELAVSPTPVREALARLESDGLVLKEPLKGYRATPLLTLAVAAGLAAITPAVRAVRIDPAQTLRSE